MDWGLIFSAANLLAMIAWAALILLPRWPALLAGLLYAGIGVLCFVYAASMISVMGGFVSPGTVVGDAAGGVDFTSIEGVRAIFSSDSGVVIGWTHYLAFDLFVGLWIARDADAKGIHRFVQAPILLFTFMLGPIGLLIWLIVREPAARRQGRWS